MKRYLIPLLIAGAIGLGGLFYLVRLYQPEKLQIAKLEGGGTLRLLNYEYGKFRSYRPPSLKRKISHWLNAKPGGLIPWDMQNTVPPHRLASTNSVGLYVWLSKTEGFGNGRNPQLYYGQILDETGWAYPNTVSQAIHWQTIVPNFQYLLFQNFPREEKTIRLQIFDGQKRRLAGFEFPNPAYNKIETIDITPNAPPIRQKGERVEAVLNSMEIRPAPGATTPADEAEPAWRPPLLAIPEFEFYSDGRLSTNWFIVANRLTDPFGNAALSWDRESPFALNPNVKAWRLQVDAAGLAQAPTASAEFSIPAPGEIFDPEISIEVGEAVLKIAALAGPGKTDYPAALEEGAFPIGAEKIPTEEEFRFHYRSQIRSLVSKYPHLSYAIHGLGKNDYYSLKWTNAEGEQWFSTLFYSSVRELDPFAATPSSQVFLKPAWIGPDSRLRPKPRQRPIPFMSSTGKVRLEVAVYQTESFEFALEPPNYP